MVAPAAPADTPTTTISAVTVFRKRTAWHAVAAGIVGPRHERAGQPTQDAWLVGADRPDVAIAVVADGHGSERYVRSDRGSRFAVQAVRDVLSASGDHIDKPIAELSRIGQDALPTQIVEAWRALVDEDIARDGGADVVAYGSTVIGAAATQTFLVVVQLGDGAAVVVFDDGAFEVVFPAEVQIGSGTYSLCSSNAPRYLQVRVFDLKATPVRLLFMATDGFDNAYASPDAFAAVGPDLVQRIAEHGLASVQERLPRWLDDAARYSADDASAALLYRSDLQPKTKSGNGAKSRQPDHTGSIPSKKRGQTVGTKNTPRRRGSPLGAVLSHLGALRNPRRGQE